MAYKDWIKIKCASGTRYLIDFNDISSVEVTPGEKPIVIINLQDNCITFQDQDAIDFMRIFSYTHNESEYSTTYDLVEAISYEKDLEGTEGTPDLDVFNCDPAQESESESERPPIVVYDDLNALANEVDEDIIDHEYEETVESNLGKPNIIHIRRK